MTEAEALQLIPYALMVLSFGLGVIAGQQR